MLQIESKCYVAAHRVPHESDPNLKITALSYLFYCTRPPIRPAPVGQGKGGLGAIHAEGTCVRGAAGDTCINTTKYAATYMRCFVILSSSHVATIW